MKEIQDERHGDFTDLFTDENLYEIKKLIESGWDVNSMLSLSSGEMRPIHLMVLRNNIDIATLLVNNGADLEGTVSRAIQSSDKTMLALLLKSGADANEIDSMNRTALKQAIIKGDYEATKLLIESGADIKIRDKFDRDSIAIAENVKSRGQKRDIGKILELLQSI
jgi:ankyrin repeat protein